MRSHALVRVLRSTLGLSLEVASEDQVLVISLGVLVDWAVVGSLGEVREVGLASRGLAWGSVFVDGGRDGVDVQDRELVEQLLGLRVLQSSVTLVPTGALQEQTVDVYTFLWLLDRFTFDTTVFTWNDLLEDIGGILDLVERPSLLLSGDLLLHGSQETLWVEEACEPE